MPLLVQGIYEIGCREPPLSGALGQKLSTVRTLLKIVKVLLLIILCCKHPFERSFGSPKDQLPELPLPPRPEGRGWNFSPTEDP
jgi:hypothetical protein